jgi:hypothetical protein
LLNGEVLSVLADARAIIGYGGIVLIIGAIVGLFIGERRGRPLAGAVLGAVLGFIGWIIIALIPPRDGDAPRRQKKP